MSCRKSKQRKVTERKKMSEAFIQEWMKINMPQVKFKQGEILVTDFHSHSTCSDGKYSPVDILRKAAMKRVCLTPFLRSKEM